MEFIESAILFFANNLSVPFLILILAVFIFIEWEFAGKNEKFKKVLIIVISSGLLVWLDARSFLLLLILSTALYYTLRIKVNYKKNLYVFVIFAIGLLILIKDYRYFLNVEKVYIPLGVSYYFFRLISMVIDYTNRPKEFESIDPIDYYTYVFFFPIILAGPIQRFRDFKELSPGYKGKERGKVYFLLLLSLSLKLFFVDGYLFNEVYQNSFASVSKMILKGKSDLLFLRVSLFGLAAFIHAYLDLMLYTEISKAFSRLLGFTVQENFNKPLLASNLSMFWQRWHMSLSNWTRDYIFFPALIRTKKTWLSTYLSMLTIGIWHAFTVNWILWAILHATGINLYGKIREQEWYKKAKENKTGERLLRYSGNIITIYFVSFVFVMVAIEDFDLAMKFYLSAFKSLLFWL